MAETPAAPRSPNGELVIRTMAMPADTNSAGDIFGGWVMSQMDLGGAILAQQTARSRVVTVAVDAMEFHRPIIVGNTVACYASIVRHGTTSLRIKVEVWAQRLVAGSQECVTEGVFTYVALDAAGKPWPVRRA